MRLRNAKLSNLVLIATFFVLSIAVAWLGWYWSSPQHSHQQEYRLSSTLGIQDKATFEPVLPNKKVTLPDDFKFHDQYQHEWWHYFATLKGADGNKYTVQFSLFRMATDEREVSGWQNSQLYLANIVLTHQDGVLREQRIARGGIGQAGSKISHFVCGSTTGHGVPWERRRFLAV